VSYINLTVVAVAHPMLSTITSDFCHITALYILLYYYYYYYYYFYCYLILAPASTKPAG